jgi:hypothetical protein
MHNAKGLAVKIKHSLGAEIARVCGGTMVPESFLAALISVENDRLNQHAFRFDRDVKDKLKRLQNPLVFWRREWNGITQADLKGASDDALTNLATSFGYTQIMGWWAIPLTKQLRESITVADIRDPLQHLWIAVRLLNLTANRYLKLHEYGAVLRIWNTGSPFGRPHDPEYVAHALAVDQEYRKLSAGVRTSSVPPRKTNDAPTVTPAPGSPALSP